MSRTFTFIVQLKPDQVRKDLPADAVINTNPQDFHLAVETLIKSTMGHYQPVVCDTDATVGEFHSMIGKLEDALKSMQFPDDVAIAASLISQVKDSLVQFANQVDNEPF